MTIQFQLNTLEIERLADFQRKQKRLAKGIRATYSFHFSSTGIGTVVEVQNNTTKTMVNITDYDSW